MLTSYIPVVIFIAVAIAFALILHSLARALGPQRESREKAIPYECGLDPIGKPRNRFSVQFYRIAILFIIFDIEAAFFYPWAVLYRELSCKGQLEGTVCHGEATAFGLLVMMVFLSVLVLALVYIWRRKALEWD